MITADVSEPQLEAICK